MADPSIASRRHTVGLLLIQSALVFVDVYLQRRPSGGPNLTPEHSGIVPLYVSMIAPEWGLVWYVWSGIRDEGDRMLDLVGGRWNSWRDVALDLAIALPFWVLWETPRDCFMFCSGKVTLKRSRFCFLGWLEIVLWVVLSASAGICEEIVFRGYLRSSSTHSLEVWAWPVVLQALVFVRATLTRGRSRSSCFPSWAPCMACWRHGASVCARA